MAPKALLDGCFWGTSLPDHDDHRPGGPLLPLIAALFRDPDDHVVAGAGIQTGGRERSNRPIARPMLSARMGPSFAPGRQPPVCNVRPCQASISPDRLTRVVYPLTTQSNCLIVAGRRNV